MSITQKNVVIMGSTGSIGSQSLEVIAQYPKQFALYALVANTQHERMLDQCLLFKPRYAVMMDSTAAQALQKSLKRERIATEVVSGMDVLCALVADAGVDIVIAAIVGGAGLLPTYAAVCASKQVLLANKEALVMAGELFMQAVRQHQATLLPLDSEHNAIFQAMPDDFLPGQEAPGSLDSIILTASGGPFLNTPLADLADVTKEQAVAHPNWSMGAKISVDSATMMNKALEVIEAHHLFALAADKIEVLIHPQSVVHSMLRYVDGSVIAQMGSPDMRIPIANLLGWPKRLLASGAQRLDFTELCSLHFQAPCTQRFPAMTLAYEAIAAGQCASISLNAANEVAVAAFLADRLDYLGIYQTIKAIQDSAYTQALHSLEDIIAFDTRIRAYTQELIAKLR